MRIKDLALATTFYVKGFRPSGIRQDGDGLAELEFPDSPALVKLRQQYALDQVFVPPRLWWFTFKSLKASARIADFSKNATIHQEGEQTPCLLPPRTT